MSFDQSLLSRRARVLGPAYRLFYDRPLHLVRGRGARVWDAEGREYLDAYNNVPSVGHCHPRVTAALAAQAQDLNTHTRYLHATVVAYAERLVATFPPGLSQVMFTCTGSEANDLALRIARAVTGAQGIIVTANAYHGVTAALAEISPALGALNPLGPHVRCILAPDSYRAGSPAQAETQFLAALRVAIADLRDKGHGVAALICDTVFASDGLFVDRPGLLNAACAEIRAAGGLFIADEVQSGLARPGTHMWAFQCHGVIPDLVTLGKPLGAGHPLAAMVAQPRHLDSFGRATRYFNTFGGNPVSASVGLAVLDVIAEEGLMQSARRVGAELLTGLRDLAGRHQVIGDVRGAGLYAAVELVTDRASKTPATAAVDRLVNLMREAGVLVGTCGKAGNCVKVRPPLCFTQDDAGRFLDVFDRCLAQVDLSGAV
jgi:4-aminobutyrate aminotransferase-like enzyme